LCIQTEASSSLELNHLKTIDGNKKQLNNENRNEGTAAICCSFCLRNHESRAEVSIQKRTSLAN